MNKFEAENLANEIKTAKEALAAAISLIDSFTLPKTAQTKPPESLQTGQRVRVYAAHADAAGISICGDPGVVTMGISEDRPARETVTVRLDCGKTFQVYPQQCALLSN